MDDENNDFIRDFYKVLPDCPKKGNKKVFVNSRLRKNPGLYANIIYEFISERKVTHYIDGIFWGSNRKRDRLYNKTEKSGEGRLGGGTHGVGAEGSVTNEHSQGSDVTIEQGVEDGVMAHTISPISTLINKKYNATRAALSQAIETYMSNMEFKLQQQNARK